MALHYQVIAEFSFSGCRPLLVGLSLYSTKLACTQWSIPYSEGGFTNSSRIFQTLKEAQSYITYLMGRYPNSPATFPVLDREQIKLIKES